MTRHGRLTFAALNIEEGDLEIWRRRLRVDLRRRRGETSQHGSEDE
jgi:hypothetical protein